MKENRNNKVYIRANQEVMVKLITTVLLLQSLHEVFHKHQNKYQCNMPESSLHLPFKINFQLNELFTLIEIYFSLMLETQNNSKIEVHTVQLS